MNCTEWEERIALHAQGDLPPQECAAAERHLAECAECREFLADLRQSLAALRAAHAEPLEASAYAAVRARVLERIDHGRGRAWWLGWIGALAAAAAVLVTLLLPRPVPPPKLAVAPPPGLNRQPALVPAPPEVSPPAKSATPKRRAAPRPESLLVKLITDDPDVVIYWITN